MFFWLNFCFSFHFFFLSFLFVPTFGSSLLDWTENAKKQNGDDHIMPFSPVMRPSQTNNRHTFMDAFVKHLEETVKIKKPETIMENASVIANAGDTTTIHKTKEKKLPKQPRKPREPSSGVKKPRKKKTDTNCTTIGLQIQIRDPNTEPATLNSSFESAVIATTYPYHPDANSTAASLPNMISNAVENCVPTATLSNTATYYNMDSTEHEPGEQYLYEPEPIYHVPTMTMMPSECVSVQQPTTIIQNTNLHHHTNGDDGSGAGGGGYPTSLHPYDLYAEQKNNASLISRFNVSHTNVSNNPPVCDTLHNWRAGNEIM